MKFDKRRSKFKIYKDRWYLIPTIILQFGDYRYREYSFYIEYHWLCFHGVLVWFDRGEKD